MRKILMGLMWGASLGAVCAEGFVEEFAKLQKAGDEAALEGFLEKAGETEKENPDYYASAGGYWWGVSQRVNLATKPAEEGDFSVRDPETDKEVGSITSVGKANPEIPRKAIALMAEGFRKFPQRVDLAFGLAHAQSESGAMGEVVATMIELLGVAKKDGGALKWTNNGPLPEKAEIFLPETLHVYSGLLFQADTPETDALCVTLTNAIVGAYPEHPYAYNIQAALASVQGKPEEAERLLEVASSKAPNDVLILENLAETYAKAGKKEKAVATYTKILGVIGVEPARKAAARKAIEGLKAGE